MESADTYAALAALDWQIELGAVDAIGDSPVDRYALAVPEPRPSPAEAVPAAMPAGADDPVLAAEAAARGAGSLGDLEAALGAFEGCELRRGARNLVFADGVPGARVMIVGEAPGREEDIQGARGSCSTGCSRPSACRGARASTSPTCCRGARRRTAIRSRTRSR
jgi:DNA polymerase